MRAAGIAVVKVATLRQRRACLAKRMTLEVSARVGGSTTADATTAGGGSGSSSAACGSACPTAVFIFFQTPGRGATPPTLWFNPPTPDCPPSAHAAKSFLWGHIVLT